MKAFVLALGCALPLQVLADPFYQQPPGHAELLAQRPQMAYPGWSAWRLDLDLLRRVNRKTYASISHKPEAHDTWGVGADCEDYAIRMLETLLHQGVPRGALRLAISRKGQEGHAVLVVSGLWVLDNLRDEPYRIDWPGANILAWETVKGRWNPASKFASLAEHLESIRKQTIDP